MINIYIRTYISYLMMLPLSRMEQRVILDMVNRSSLTYKGFLSRHNRCTYLTLVRTMSILCARGVVVKRKRERRNVFYFSHRGSYFAGELSRMANLSDSITIYDRRPEVL